MPRSPLALARNAFFTSFGIAVFSLGGGCAVDATPDVGSSTEALHHCHGHSCGGSTAPSCTTIPAPPELAMYGCSPGVLSTYGGYPDNAWVFTCPAGTPRPGHLLGLPQPTYGTNWEEELNIETDFSDGTCVSAPPPGYVEVIDWYTQGVSGGCHGTCGEFNQ